MLSLVSQRSALHFAEGYRDPETALAASWGPPSHALHPLVLGSGTKRQHPSAQPLRVHSPDWENLRLPHSLSSKTKQKSSLIFRAAGYREMGGIGGPCRFTARLPPWNVAASALLVLEAGVHHAGQKAWPASLFHSFQMHHWLVEAQGHSLPK